MADESVRHDFDDRADDIRAAFDAIEKESTAETVAPKEPKAAAQQPAEEVGEEQAVETEAAPDSVEPQADGEPGGEATAGGDALEPPKNWSQVDKEIFKELPAAGQKFLLDRHSRMEADYTKKTQEVAEFRKEYGAIDDLFSPYKGQMRASGHTPYTTVQAWMNVEQALMDPAQRAGVIRRMIDAYKIDPSEIIGTAPQQARPSNPDEDRQRQEVEALLSPYLTPLQKQIQEITGAIPRFNEFMQTAQQREQMNAVQRVQTEIENFANAKNDKGELAHPYFKDVEDNMALLANGYKASNQPVPTLEALYDMAVRANPLTFGRLEARRQTAGTASAQGDARAKAARAKRAGSSVTGAPHGGQPKLNGAGVDDIRTSLESAFDEAMSR